MVTPLTHYICNIAGDVLHNGVRPCHPTIHISVASRNLARITIFIEKVPSFVFNALFKVKKAIIVKNVFSMCGKEKGSSCKRRLKS